MYTGCVKVSFRQSQFSAKSVVNRLQTLLVSDTTLQVAYSERGNDTLGVKTITFKFE